MTTTNYFVVPARARVASRMHLVKDEGTGMTITIGESSFVLLERYDVQVRTKVWKMTGERSLIPTPLGVTYYRARLATDAGESGASAIVRLERNVPPVLIESDSDEWIAIKVARILENEPTPQNFDWSRYFMFDDRDPVSTLKAFEAARLVSPSVAVYRPIAIPGPWSSASLVGTSARRIDPVDWKTRALAAEAKLHGYRRLRELANDVFAQALEYGPRQRGEFVKLGAAVDAMAEELGHLDVVDAPKDLFSRSFDVLGAKFRMQQVTGLEQVSTFDASQSLIAVKADQPEAAKLLGLLYQLIQIADLARRGASDFPAAIQTAWIQDRVATIGLLLVASGVVDPALGILPSDIQAIAEE